MSAHKAAAEGRVPQEEKCRVIPGQGAHDHVHIHGIHGRAGCRGEPRHGLHHDDVLGIVAGNHALAEDVVELGRGVALELLGHGAVAVAAVLPQLLDDAKLLDIPEIVAWVVAKPQASSSWRSCSWVSMSLVSNQFQNFRLSVGFHGTAPYGT